MMTVVLMELVKENPPLVSAIYFALKLVTVVPTSLTFV